MSRTALGRSGRALSALQSTPSVPACARLPEAASKALSGPTVSAVGPEMGDVSSRMGDKPPHDSVTDRAWSEIRCFATIATAGVERPPGRWPRSEIGCLSSR